MYLSNEEKKHIYLCLPAKPGDSPGKTGNAWGSKQQGRTIPWLKLQETKKRHPKVNQFEPSIFFA
jgi:hypothetical protein